MELYESTQTESNQRVAKLLPTTGSEDVSNLIKIPPSDRDISVAESSSASGSLPNEKVDIDAGN
jgi:hypothetical protein